jgi:putative NADH-flavin reductase
MKLAIFGATGKTGSLLLEQALQAGHKVAALARDPAHLTAREGLQIVRGSATSQTAIAEVVDGADAVLSAMGGGRGTLVSFGQNVIAAMDVAGVSRIVSLVGASVVMPGDPSSLGLTLLRAVTHFMAADVVRDGAAHAIQLAKTDVAYTLVRPPRLTLGPATGGVRHAHTLPLSPFSSIARADLAAFMLRVATEAMYLRAAPMVAHGR